MNSYINSLLNEFSKSRNFDPYISSIIFPNYKNVSNGQEINFDFPLTLLLGKNGANKSSILHALYGCPDGKSTEDYWFSTHVDKISSKNRQSFFYRYVIPDTQKSVEVLKTMIQRKDKPEYWEPSRPLTSLGMEKMEEYVENAPFNNWRSKTRWNAIQKDVLYLDFRAEISAFDKAFYKDRYSPVSRVDHRHKLRKRSKNLKKAIDTSLCSHIYHTKQRIFCNVKFNQTQRDQVNNILGASYNKIVYIEHDYYLSDSFSVYLGTDEADNYSEAFAGSGETSVVRLVYALNTASEKALVLLDEPETSLHIEAQYRLQKFILEKIKEKKLQVVMSTHSPFFAKGLPDNAIKVLLKNSESKKIDVLNSAPAEESSFYLGYKRESSGKAIIYVEDQLAKAVCDHVISIKLNESEADRIAIEVFPGGKDELLKLAASESIKDSSNCSFYFDGDVCTQTDIPDPDTIPSKENANLEDLLQDTFGGIKIKFPQNSNEDEQKYENIRNFLKFSRERVEFLPFNVPEDFLVSASDMFKDERSSGLESKEIIKKEAERKLDSSGYVTSQDILTIQRLALHEVPNDHETFETVAKSLRRFKKHAP